MGDLDFTKLRRKGNFTTIMSKIIEKFLFSRQSYLFRNHILHYKSHRIVEIRRGPLGERRGDEWCRTGREGRDETNN